MHLKDKVAIITGGVHGLAEIEARLFAAEAKTDCGSFESALRLPCSRAQAALFPNLRVRAWFTKGTIAGMRRNVQQRARCAESGDWQGQITLCCRFPPSEPRPLFPARADSMARQYEWACENSRFGTMYADHCQGIASIHPVGYPAAHKEGF
jgi:hypothetical protein